MKVTFKHEADNNKNESITDTFDIDPGEFALMIATDRQQRAAATGVPLDQVKPCTPQKILDELWNAEEAATHKAVRGDRGKGKKKCMCGAGCGPRRGCRVPNNAPFSYEQMLEIDLDPASPGISAEDQVIERENSVQRAREIAALWNVIDGLDPQHREVMVRLLATDKLNQAAVARDMGLTRARVSQLVAEVKPLIRQAVEAARFNTFAGVGSGVKGEANRATPINEEER
ncbi:sigma factor-like helix-turn-helix DNA-binding protein [Arcanobacterium hippocoleae]|uniref:DNA-directed RNA polymerase specialized sigma24 family protein n=1 Tax=Arcanobacterium hippocoleae TaxID=149017 RepID=A0ABU1T3H9_9ACTO|nr:sigma factor-like helix-turn-helix DNA-binding protein [Arcanobacterium hippocoleae]MDR6939421.1 DNA-directed RNA polymerase specialized sigma24 family protein [Arcanobacterium hippocoleae]